MLRRAEQQAERKAGNKGAEDRDELRDLQARRVSHDVGMAALRSRTALVTGVAAGPASVHRSAIRRSVYLLRSVTYCYVQFVLRAHKLYENYIHGFAISLLNAIGVFFTGHDQFLITKPGTFSPLALLVVPKLPHPGTGLPASSGDVGSNITGIRAGTARHDHVPNR